MVGDVIESSAQGPIKSGGVKALLKSQVQPFIGGKAVGARGANNLLLVIDRGERETGVYFERVGHIKAANEGKNAPGNKPVGYIPRIRPGHLRAEREIVQRIVEHLVRGCAGAHVRAEEGITLAEGAPQADLEGIVMILARVFEQEVRADCACRCVVDEVLTAGAANELGFEKDLRRKFLFEGDAPVHESWRQQVGTVGVEGGDEGSGVPLLAKESVESCAALRLCDQPQICQLIINPNTCRQLGVPGVAERVGAGQARGKERLTNNFIP